MLRSVFVVDDDAKSRCLITGIMTSWGHAIIGEADSVTSALTQAAKLRPDVVLVDIGLPDSIGFSLAEQPVTAICRKPAIVPANTEHRRVQAALMFLHEQLSGP
jgi:CheY-like chemotaxis protein